MDETRTKKDCSWTKKDRCYHPVLYKTKDCDNSCDFKTDTHFCAFIHDSDKPYLKDLGVMRYQVIQSLSEKKSDRSAPNGLHYLSSSSRVEDSSESKKGESVDEDSSTVYGGSRKELASSSSSNITKNQSNSKNNIGGKNNNVNHNNSKNSKLNQQNNSNKERFHHSTGQTMALESSEDNGKIFKIDSSEHSSDEYDFQSDIVERDHLENKRDEKNDEIDAEEGSSIFKSSSHLIVGSSDITSSILKENKMKKKDKLRYVFYYLLFFFFLLTKQKKKKIRSLLPLFAGQIIDCNDGCYYKIEKISNSSQLNNPNPNPNPNLNHHHPPIDPNHNINSELYFPQNNFNNFANNFNANNFNPNNHHPNNAPNFVPLQNPWGHYNPWGPYQIPNNNNVDNKRSSLNFPTQPPNVSPNPSPTNLSPFFLSAPLNKPPNFYSTTNPNPTFNPLITNKQKWDGGNSNK